MSNGAITDDRIQEIREENDRVYDAGEETRKDEIIRELLDALAYERGVCASQVNVIKKLRDRREDGDPA